MAGRKPGAPNKTTLLKRDNLLSAIEVCRVSKISPPQLMAEAMTLIRTLALNKFEGSEKLTQDERNALMASLTEQERDRIIRRLVEASRVAYWLMDFAYPRLQRIETVGDAPMIVENATMVITLAADERGIWEREKPEIEVIEDAATNGGPRSAVN